MSSEQVKSVGCFLWAAAAVTFCVVILGIFALLFQRAARLQAVADLRGAIGGHIQDVATLVEGSRFDAADQEILAAQRLIETSEYFDSSLSEDVDLARGRLAVARRDHESKVSEGYRVLDGRLVSPTEYKDAERRRAEEEHRRAEEERQRQEANQRMRARAREREQELARQRELEKKRLVEVKKKTSATVDGLSYEVRRVWWANKITESWLSEWEPKYSFLCVEVRVSNNTLEPQALGRVKLRDDEGATYLRTHIWGWSRNLDAVLNMVNPRDSCNGVAVFDIRKDRQYRLLVTGGLLSGEPAELALGDGF